MSYNPHANPSMHPSIRSPGQYKHPIHSIPVEILLKVFLACVPTPDPDPHAGLPEANANQAPLNIARVCSHWRQIALSCKGLWAAVSLGLSRDERGKRRSMPAVRPRSRNDVKALQEFALRSGNLPLAVDFHSFDHNSFRKVFQEIVSLRGRLRYLKIHMFSVNAQEVLEGFSATALTVPLPHLRSLIVDIYRFDRSADPFELDLRFAPRLEYFEYSGSIANYSLPLPPTHGITGSNLLSLTLWYYPRIGKGLPWLDHCPSLEKLALIAQSEWIRPTDRDEDRRDGVVRTLPRLTEFKFVDDSEPDVGMVGSFLDHLRMPALQTLSLHVCTRNEPGFMAHLSDFIIRSNSPLTSLTVTDVCMEPGDFIQFLRTVPNIRHLTTYGGLLTNDTLYEFNIAQASNSEAIICPLLSSLTLHSCHSCSPESLRDVIVSRFRPTASSTRYHISNWDLPDMVNGGSVRLSQTVPVKAGLQQVKLFRCSPDLETIQKQPGVRACMEEGLSVEIGHCCDGKLTMVAKTEACPKLITL